MLTTSSSANAGEGDARAAAQSLLTALDSHTLEAWIAAWVDDPREGSKTRAAERWRHLLRGDGPVASTLSATAHIAATSDGPDYTRVVFDSAPLLSLIVRHDGASVIGMETTSCVSCSEPHRFALDLIEDVRRRGALGYRLHPGIELWVDEEIHAQAAGRPDHWLAIMAARFDADQSIATMIAGAAVQDEGDGLLSVSYPDGSSDTWQVVRLSSRWALDYGALHPDSPLRLDPRDTRRWRRLSRRQDVARQTWTPSWTAVDGACGTMIGHHAVGAAFVEHDNKVWIASQDLDRAHSALYEVDLTAEAVTGRWHIPVRSTRSHLEVGSWYTRWHAALSPRGDEILVSAPRELWRIKPSSREMSSLHRAHREAYIGWTHDGRPLWSSTSGRLSIDGTPHRLIELQHIPLAVHLDGPEVTTLLANGQLAKWSVTDEEIIWQRTVCGGHPLDGARQRTEDTWLITCSSEAPHGFELVSGVLGSGDAYGAAGLQSAGAAWSFDGRWFAIPMPPGHGETLSLWDALHMRPVATFGLTPAREISFSNDGEQLLTVQENGDVILWSIPELRLAHPVIQPRR